MLPSAERLTGLKLEGGWNVISPAPKEKNSTGGYFSKGYFVENDDGRKAFLKALDISRALREDDPALALQSLTEAFNFERDVLIKCKDERLDHIVLAIDSGTVRFENAFDGGAVQYLIFELADGDVRKQSTINERFNVAWSLRSLHNIAVGLQQLHSHGIAHQDLKPSNVLVFGGKTSKISDFGRAAYKGHTPPHEGSDIAGDLSYAPPELFYGYVDPEWNNRRFGCDAYLMGSMALYFYLGVGATVFLFNELPEDFASHKWKGSFDEVLPYLHDAFQRVLEKYRSALPISVQDELIEIVSQLCTPDPRLRGHPKNRHNQHSMERYISKLNLLARKAELGILVFD